SFKSLLLADRKQKSNQQGFTIVEVMIVLAIAGLILAVVFVAVPAMQRNQRNGARNNDRAFIRTQYDQASANAGGRVPANISLKPDELNKIGRKSDNTLSYQVTNANMGAGDVDMKESEVRYVTAQSFINTATSAFIFGNDGTNDVEPADQIVIVAGGQCDSAETDDAKKVDQADVDKSTRSTSLAIFYMIEGEDPTYCVDDVN
ncbi:MAG: type II secretion system protein, partial [Candidatus Saccharibacteria bacterium]|nr:type II secretion system protein [Candidatus Saccharibacteria bacterium]